MEIPTTLLLTLSLLQGQAAPQHGPQPIKDLVHVPVQSHAELQTIHTLCSDVDDHHPVAMSGHAVVFATDAEQEALAEAGIAFTVEQEDLTAFYAERAAADLARTQGQQQSRGTGAVVGGSMGGFKTLAEIEAEMDRLAATYPLLCSPKFSIGTSIEGRPIWGMRISTTPGTHDPQKPVAWFDAIHHSREPMSGESQLLFADEILADYGTDTVATRLIETRNIVILPCVNPDGYEYNRQIAPGGGGLWRKNRRDNGDGTDGVDLNRNYDWEWGPQWQGSSGNTSSETYRGTAPFSEPESTAVAALMATMPPAMSMSSHSFSNLMLYPWGYDTIVTPDDAAYRQYGSLFTADNGWPRGTIWQVLYIANGGSVDYHYGEHGTLAFTPEIGSNADGFWPAPSRILPLYDDIRPSYFGNAQYTGAWAEVTDFLWTELSGDGDAWQEPGESWSLVLEVANRGLAGLDVDFQLASNHPDLSVSGLPGNLVLAPGASGQSAAFTVDFSATAPSGVPLGLDLSLDYEGWSDTTALDVILGRQRVLLRDRMEASDFGWSTNNNTNWSWERADPEATSSGGSDVQPGSDFSTPGTLCWVTGAAAGSSVGTNDVDGTAILTSPVFDLSEVANATLHYARWFANRPGGPVDDRWVTELSNDGGSTWTVIEDLGDTGSNWVEMESELTALPFTDTMRLRITVADDPNDDITEGLLDDLEVRTLQAGPSLGFWGETATGGSARFVIDGDPGASFDLAYSGTRTLGSTTPGIAGTLYLGAPNPILSGSCGADGVGMVDVSLPASVAGLTLHFQGVVGLGTPSAEFTNPISVSFQ